MAEVDLASFSAGFVLGGILVAALIGGDGAILDAGASTSQPESWRVVRDGHGEIQSIEPDTTTAQLPPPQSPTGMQQPVQGQPQYGNLY